MRQLALFGYLADGVLGEGILTASSGKLLGKRRILSKGLINQFVNGGSTRAQAALYRLRWLMENGKPFTVYTPHGIYGRVN